VAPTQSAAAATQSTAAPASILRSPNSEAVPSANLDPAKLLVHIDPVYPQTARAENVHGSSDVQATIGKDGVPRALKTTRGDPRLAAAAIAAISRWRYRPAMRNGQPEESQITIIVNFTQ
jgi:protein TonB